MIHRSDIYHIILQFFLVFSLSALTAATVPAQEDNRKNATETAPSENGSREPQADIVPAAENGDAETQREAGDAFYYGRGTETDGAKALACFLKAARGGNVYSARMAGEIFSTGAAGEKDTAEAVYWLKKAAEAGDSEAAYRLGSIYFHGGDPEAEKWLLEAAEKGYGEDTALLLGNIYYSRAEAGDEKAYKTAADWFLKGAEAGNTEAQYRAGLLYEAGKGVAADYGKATEMFEAAAGKNHADALSWLADIYAEGKDGKAADRQKAEELYAKAAGLGNTYAMYRLAGIYYGGGGDTEGCTKALPLYVQASAAGLPEAEYRLAVLFKNGECGLRANGGYAVKLLKEAASSGNGDALSGLKEEAGKGKTDAIKALISLYGTKYVDRDGILKLVAGYNSSLDYLRISTDTPSMPSVADCSGLETLRDSGEKKDRILLGYMYSEGKCAERDYKKAEELLRPEADGGDPEAQYILGNIYLNTAAADNAGKATEMYFKSAGAGNPFAQFFIGRLYYTGNIMPKDPAAAALWYKRAAARGLTDAQMNLAGMYLNGEGIKADAGKAVFWYRKAAEKGNKNAVQNLEGIAEKGNYDARAALCGIFGYGEAGTAADAGKADACLKKLAAGR